MVLFAETGLRAAELLDLDMSDIDLDDCVLHGAPRQGRQGPPGAVLGVVPPTVLDRYTTGRRASGAPADAGRCGWAAAGR